MKRYLMMILTWALIASAASASSWDVIICGAGGESEYIDRFKNWGERLETALVENLQHEAEHVKLLIDTNSTTAPKQLIEDIRQTFAELKDTMSEGDQLFVFMIGHGSYQRDASKFNLTGPDLTPEELDRMLGALPAKKIGIVNGSSASAGFINVLSGENRVICTGTRNVEQNNATEFMEYFVEGLERGRADVDRDERISMLEACEFADALTAAYYENEGLIQTENSLIDDNGDKRGTRLAQLNRLDEATGEANAGAGGDKDKLDGAVAGRIWLKDYTFPDSVPRELIDQYLAKLAEIEEWKLQKLEMELNPYYGRLERLLIEAAQLNRKIHDAMEGKASRTDGGQQNPEDT